MIEEDQDGVAARQGRRKQEASKAAYARSKSRAEHVLLRLGKGSLALLDSARAGAGLSRSAYVEAWLRSGVGIILTEQAATPPMPPPASIGEEFEALFGGGG